MDFDKLKVLVSFFYISDYFLEIPNSFSSHI